MIEDRLALIQLRPLDESAMEGAKRRWASVAKPLGSLGLLEEAVITMAGIQGKVLPDISKRALVVMCADNGVVAEGVTQTGQEVTAIVTENFTRGETCSCIMAERVGVEVFPVDIGVAAELKAVGNKYPLTDKKIRSGTANMYREPAMTVEEAREAIAVGIHMVEQLKNHGYHLILTGEMGIGNTTTSSAVASVLLGKEPELMTGKGAGLTDSGLHRKIQVIRESIQRRKPNWEDGVDVLSKVGGLDLAGLAGIFIGGAIYRIPVVVDGFISGAAALAAAAICPEVKQFMLASHVSAEPAGRLVLDELGLRPVVQAGMCLGEGTGALTIVPLLDMTLDVYRRMSTFEEIEVAQYQPL